MCKGLFTAHELNWNELISSSAHVYYTNSRRGSLIHGARNPVANSSLVSVLWTSVVPHAAVGPRHCEVFRSVFSDVARLRRVCVCMWQADGDGDVPDGPQTVSDGLADLSARDREL